MSFFSNEYPYLRWPLESASQTGFRLPQAGALHAIGAHFAKSDAPAIVTMPTGSGKTAVLMASPFLLRAERTLVITPSRLVREQIVEGFSQLHPLRVMGVLDRTRPLPTVTGVKQRVTTQDQWQSFEKADVVVATPYSISPGLDDVAAPPTDLFDLVLIDEAHHSPARIWHELIMAFPKAKRVLFTATPYRDDRSELQGEFIYTYELSAAFRDGVFGTIEFIPVEGTQETTDLLIAQKTVEVFRADRKKNLKHLVIVRTGTKTRARQLQTLYETHTELRLKPITSDNSLSHAKAVIAQLRSGKLDGIVCVDMLGEGFDLPELKIAALHTPHRSLPVTLQFIGRFARTNAKHIGRAAFVASRSEMSVEKVKLFEEGAVWSTIIPRLSDARIRTIQETQRVLSRFHSSGDLLQRRVIAVERSSFEDVSLHSFYPYHHAKIFTLFDGSTVSLDAQPPGNLGNLVYRRLTNDGTCGAYVFERIEAPEFTDNPRFRESRFNLVIVYHSHKSRLLFVNSSDRSEGVLEILADTFIDGPKKPLSLARLNKVLLDLANPEFFNIGMRNRIRSNVSETYRIITGSDAARAVQQTDGRLYHRGHFFGRAEEEGASVTIGLSSASKVWSNKFDSIPGLLEWFRRLAKKLRSEKSPHTGSGLDYLTTGKEIDTLPSDIIAGEWERDAFDNLPDVIWTDGDGMQQEASIVDADIIVRRDRQTTSSIGIDLIFDSFCYSLDFDLLGDVYFKAIASSPAVMLRRGRTELPLVDYLNARPLNLYTASLGLVSGNNYFEEPAGAHAAFDPNEIQEVDWKGSNVDVTAEITTKNAGQQSIHDYIESMLRVSKDQVIVCDHGTGEAADFIAIGEDKGIQIRLYHCKGTKSSAEKQRLDDAYEVCGQAIKSLMFATKRQMRAAIERRVSRKNPSRFAANKGDLKEVQRILSENNHKPLDVQIIIVQPGLSRRTTHAGVLTVLAATKDYITKGGCALMILGSS